MVAYWHVWTTAGSTVGTTTSDPAQSMWFLSWTSYALTHGLDPLHSASLNAPFGVNLLANTGMQLLGVLGTPLEAAFGPLVTYNVLLTLAMPLSALAMYALACRYVRRRGAAFLAGLVYGFSPYMVGQGSVHLHLVFAPFPPLVWLALDELVARRRRSPVLVGAALAALLAAQFFVSIEVFACTVVLAAVTLAGLAALHPSQARAVLGRAATGLGTAAAGSVAVLAYPVWFTLRGPAHIAGPIQLFPELYRADLVSAITPTSNQLFGPAAWKAVGDATLGGNLAETGAYVGVPLLAVALVVALVRRRRPEVQAAALVAAVAWVLSLGSRLVVHGTPSATAKGGLPLPGALLWRLPGFENAQPIRLSLFVFLGCAVLLAVAVDAVAAPGRWPEPSDPARGQRTIGRALRAGPAGASAMALLVAAVAVAPLVPAWPYPAGRVPVPGYFTSPRHPAVRGVTLVYPFPSFGVDRAAPMLWQAEAGMRFQMPGGYALVPQAGTRVATATRASLTFTSFSELFEGTAPPRTPRERAALRAEWAAWGVRTVLAAPSGKRPERALAFLTWVVGARPAVSGGVRVWRLPAAPPSPVPTARAGPVPGRPA